MFTGFLMLSISYRLDPLSMANNMSKIRDFREFILDPPEQVILSDLGDLFWHSLCIHIGNDVIRHVISITMKVSFFISIMALTVWACSPVKEASRTSAALTRDSRDSTEYEVVIIDIGFDQWYLTNYSEAKDRSNEYYRYKNQVAIANWNDYYHLGRYDRVIESYIDYRPNIDYGIEVNRKLFWYFKYVKSKYGINLF